MTTAYPPESLSTDMPLLPEVVIDGHKVAGGSKDAIAEIYDLINTANLNKIRKHADDQASLGIITPYNLTITDAGTETILKQNGIPNGQAFSLINDGPATVQVAINKRLPLAPVIINQAYNVNFGNHVLEWFYLICAAGLTANVRVVIKS